MSHLAFYGIYLAVSLSITVWVGTTLRTNGRKFLLRVLESEDMADTVNHLLQVRFYLANVGYIALVLRVYEPFFNAQAVVETGLPKLGGVLLILGIVHLFHMLILARMRRRSDEPSHSGHAGPHSPAKVLEEAYHLRS